MRALVESGVLGLEEMKMREFDMRLVAPPSTVFNDDLLIRFSL